MVLTISSFKNRINTNEKDISEMDRKLFDIMKIYLKKYNIKTIFINYYCLSANLIIFFFKLKHK